MFIIKTLTRTILEPVKTDNREVCKEAAVAIFKQYGIFQPLLIFGSTLHI